MYIIPLFFMAAAESGSICRRYPPLAELTWVDLDASHSTRGYSTTSFFPPMKPEGWCGEHVLSAGAVN